MKIDNCQDFFPSNEFSCGFLHSALLYKDLIDILNIKKKF